MSVILSMVDLPRLTSILSSGFLLTLVLLVISLFRNVKLRSENDKLKSKQQ